MYTTPICEDKYQLIGAISYIHNFPAWHWNKKIGEPSIEEKIALFIEENSSLILSNSNVHAVATHLRHLGKRLTVNFPGTFVSRINERINALLPPATQRKF